MIGLTILTFAWVILVMAFYASKEASYHLHSIATADMPAQQSERQRTSFLSGWFPNTSQSRREPARNWDFFATGRWWLHVAVLTIVLVALDRIMASIW
jgi:hypothetical protein